MTELRRVDPRTLVPNPNNPRKTQPDARAEHQLALNIKTVGLIHAPCVRELEDGRLMIVAGHRRVRACIAAKLTEIDVHVRSGDEKSDTMAAVAENVVRADMTESEQWRGVLDVARENADPWDLVGAFILALSANNVKVHGDDTYEPYGSVTERDLAVARIFPEGVLVRDPDLLRNAALGVLSTFMNCGLSQHSGSGLPAQILGVLFGADEYMPTMAFEEFLKSYSKPGITKAVQAEGLEEKPTGKAMREALMAHLGEKRWVPEPATFAAGLPEWKSKIEDQAARLAARARFAAQMEEEEGDADTDVITDSEEDDTCEEGGELDEGQTDQDSLSDGDDSSHHDTIPDDPRIPSELTELARAMPERLEVIMV